MTIQASTHAHSTAVADRESQIAEAIRHTITYADLFKQAISETEILRYLEVRADENEVRQNLVRYVGTLWHECAGLYCLPGRQELFAQTRQHWQLAQTKWTRARHWAAIMARLPFVRMIAVTGSLAMNNMGPHADIDYLVVTARGRVWFTRLLLITVVRVARLFRDELCPNYVLSTEVLCIQDQNFFIARELAQMVPIFGFDVYRQMLALNPWFLNYLPHASNPPPAPPEIKLGRFAQKIKARVEAWLRSPLGDRLEAWEMKQKIARLRKMPGAEFPNVVLTAEQCKGHFRGTHWSVANQFDKRVQ